MEQNRNQTPRANRVHIGFFGRRNAGKSSLINAVAGQTISVVSPVCGTTTDTVEKAMELLPIGAVVLIDTPGLDDTGTLGELRVQQARRAFSHTNLAVLVIDASTGMTEADHTILQQLEQQQIPVLQVWNKCDIADSVPHCWQCQNRTGYPDAQGTTGKTLPAACRKATAVQSVRQPAPTGGRGASGHSH